MKPQIPHLAVQPMGTEIASFDTYPEITKAVDTLADAQFDVSAVTIVGTDPKVVEQVVGRLTWGRVITSGLVSGAMMGLLFSLFFVLLVPGPWALVLAWTIAGALGFAIAQGIGYALTGGQRDFATAGQKIVATRYGLQVRPEVAAAARQILTEKGILRAPAPQVDLSTPPRYGERIEPAPGAENPPAN